MCHYTAALRGLVARRPTAQFHLADKHFVHRGRSFPSVGVFPQQLAGVLSELDLPPDSVELAMLGRETALRWHDTPLVARRYQQLEALDAPSQEIRRKKIRLEDDVVSLICQYLNSGYPVIYGSDRQTTVICGYLRGRDLTKASFNLVEKSLKDAAAESTTDAPGPDPSMALSDPEAVLAFIENDDERGPYRIRSVDAVLRAMAGKLSSLIALEAPLPRGLWLPGRDAEEIGASVLSGTIQRLADLEAEDRPPIPDETQTHLARLASQVVDGSDPGALTLRTYVACSTDYKQLYAARFDEDVDRESRTLIGFAPLPRFVWVVELIDNSKWTSRTRESVIGEVVIDASSPIPYSAMPLVMRLPGLCGRLEPGSRSVELSSFTWVACSHDSYRCGRWDMSDGWQSSAMALAVRVKSSFPQYVGNYR